MGSISTLISRRKVLAGRLVAARECAGYSQKAVAEAGIVSQSTLSKIENGDRNVTFLLLEDLANLYKQPISFFYTLYDE